MKIPKDYTNEELDAILNKMDKSSVLFLRAATAKLVQSLVQEQPLILMFLNPDSDEADVYAKGLDNKEIYDSLVNTADLMLDTMASAPSTDTTQ